MVKSIISDPITRQIADFSKICFETLLDFSLLRNEACPTAAEASAEDALLESSLTNKLAITSLLQRFKEVLVDAIDGEKLNRNIPLQRQKTAEIVFVLRAIPTVISMKRQGVRIDVIFFRKNIGSATNIFLLRRLLEIIHL